MNITWFYCKKNKLVVSPESIYNWLNRIFMIGYLTKEQSETLLSENMFGHIGCNDGFNTYVYPSNYVYDGKYIYCHSLPGAKIAVMRNNKRICFLVEKVIDFTNWKSVMVLGTFEELEDERSRYYALKAFNSKSLQVKISKDVLISMESAEKHPDVKVHNSRPVIYRILMDEMNGRYETS